MIYTSGINKEMRSPLKLFVLFLILLCTGNVALYAQEFPSNPNRLVSDFTNTLTYEQIQALENKLLRFEDSTSNQIAVVLIKSTGPYDIADYTVQLAKKWGVGNKKHNNGVVLLAALGDRAVTIQTGYGMEGVLPDVIAYRIIENEIKPAFRNSDYYLGLNQATDAIISYTKGEYKAEPKKRNNNDKTGTSGIVLIIIFIIIILISKKGGNNGGKGEIMGGKGSSDLFWWTLLNEMGRSGGGGRGGFGGGSGGGFGGFGGGGFGGGGASGRW